MPYGVTHKQKLSAGPRGHTATAGQTAAVGWRVRALIALAEGPGSIPVTTGQLKIIRNSSLRGSNAPWAHVVHIIHAIKTLKYIK